MSRVRRYPSDTTDAQGTLIDALLPDPAWLAGQGGRREVHCLLCVLVTAASVQDRDAARPLLTRLAASCHRVRLAWADGGYAGKLITWAKATHKIVVHIVKRTDDLTGFQRLPRRWVVERTWPGSPATAAASTTTNNSHNTTQP